MKTILKGKSRMKCSIANEIWCCALFCMSAVCAYGYGGFAYTETQNGITWKYETNFQDDNWVSYIEGVDDKSKLSGKVVIPTRLGGYPVAAIDKYAFKDCDQITEISMPDSVVCIAESAFAFCSGMSIATLPNRLEKIEKEAFRGCRSLTELIIPNSVTNIGEESFYFCTGLKHITVGDGLRSIPEVAFSGVTNLTSVTIGSSLESIPRDFTYVEVLSAINVSPASPHYSSVDGVLYDKARSRLIRCPRALTAVSVPFGVRTIGANSFEACQKLSNIAMSSTVIDIEANAFYNCRFSNIALPNGLSNIGDYAFVMCTNLMQVALPNSVTNVGSGAFYGCKSLCSVIFQDDAPMVGNDAFVNVCDACCAYVPTKASGYDADSDGKWHGLTLKRVENPGLAGGGSEVEVRYALNDSPSDRSVAAITVNTDITLDDFTPVDGKVYDSLLYVNNTSDHEVALSLPSGHVYKTVKGAKPLAISASSQCIISITRIADNVFLVMCEELETVQ